MLNGIWSHINLIRKGEIIIDLVSLQGTQVEIKPFQMEYDIVGNIFETGPVKH
jgi:hypothetical protein